MERHSKAQVTRAANQERRRGELRAALEQIGASGELLVRYAWRAKNYIEVRAGGSAGAAPALRMSR